MAIFPAIEPAQRSYDLGEFPVTEQPAFSADAVRFKHGTTAANYRLQLEYVYLTDAEATEIRNHFQSQGGSYQSFQLPAIIWKGHTFSGNVFPATTSWRYANAIEETHLSGALFNLSITLISDGAYEGSQVKPVDITFTGGAGSTNDRLVAGFSLSVTASFVGGEPYGDVIFAKDFLINKVTTILHFNGANNSTVKTDSSFYANTVVDDSPGADSIISTAQSKFGGASLYMDGTTSLIIDNPSINIGATEDHTVEFWFYPFTTTPGLTGLCSLRGSDTTTPSINLWAGVGTLGNVTITLQVCGPLISKIYQQTYAGQSGLWPDGNAWNHVAYSRIGTTYYLFVNGARIDSIVNSYPISVGRILRIGTAARMQPGATYYDPYVAPNLSPARGYMDDFRITKGVARYIPNTSTIASFTPPFFQHPDPEL